MIEVIVSNIKNSLRIKFNGKELEGEIKLNIDWNTNTEVLTNKKLLIEYIDKESNTIKTIVFKNIM